MNWLGSVGLQLQIAGQVLLAMFLSGLIGYERETKEKPAGLRTHILVGGAAALFVGLGDVVTRRMVASLGTTLVRVDAIRIIQAIVTGIAFLGAGTIMRRSDEEEARGLTTAASILFVSGIGITVASAEYVLAVLITLFGLFVLHGIDYLKHRFNI